MQRTAAYGMKWYTFDWEKATHFMHYALTARHPGSKLNAHDIWSHILLFYHVCHFVWTACATLYHRLNQSKPICCNEHDPFPMRFLFSLQSIEVWIHICHDIRQCIFHKKILQNKTRWNRYREPPLIYAAQFCNILLVAIVDFRLFFFPSLSQQNFVHSSGQTFFC